MMRVLLDENTCETDAGTVGQAIARGAELAERSGRVIIEVLVDGELLSEDALAADETGSTSAGEVRMITAEPAALVGETFAQAAEALVEADTLQCEAAELIQADDHEAGLRKLGEAIEIWLQVQQAIVKGAALVGLDLEKTVIDGTPINETIQGLAKQLESMRDAVEVRDPISLADTLLYELPEVVEQWRGLLESLRGRVRGGA